MDSALDFALTAVWIGFGALLAYHVFTSWRRGEQPPFFGMLERYELSIAQVERVAGGEALGAALRRCERCRDKKDCARALDAWLGRGPLACSPNAEFFKQVKGVELKGAELQRA